MTRFYKIVLLTSATILLSGCAYTTATRVTASNRDSISGIPFFLTKTFIVINGQGVSTVSVNDCSQMYVLQFGTVFAKNKVDVSFTNQVMTGLTSDQDSTLLPLEFFKAFTESQKAKQLGAGLSEKASGGTDIFRILSVECDASGKLIWTEDSRLTGKTTSSYTPPDLGEPMPGGGAPRQ